MTMKIKSSLFTLLLCSLFLASPGSEITWHTLELLSKGRIDALAHLGNGVVILGTRDTNPALCYKSTDYGITWKKMGEIPSSEKRVGVTCVESGGNGICYMLNESSEFFRSVDSGETWQRISKLSRGSNDEGFALSYGICVTGKGTVLVSDANSTGGSIYRSTDLGLTFSKTGPVSSRGLYRFSLTGKYIIVNGWEGKVFISKDDGLTWKGSAQGDQSPLYATETVGGGRFLQGTKSGNVFLGNASQGLLTLLGKPGGAADDFVYIGNGMVVYTTFTDSQAIFVSYDLGTTWTDEGQVPTTKDRDWLDHVIRVEKSDSIVVIGGTNRGCILRSAFSKKDLSKMHPGSHPIK